MKSIILGVHLFVLLFCSTLLFAQKKTLLTEAHLTGHVIDLQNNEHIPFVYISIKGTTFAGTSDATGHFFLKNLPVGSQIIVASSVGYKTIEQEVEIVANKIVEINLSMSPQLLQIDDVVVTGTRNETNRRSSSTIVNVISPKLFEYTASNNIAQVMNFQPGLRVEYNCSNCGFSQLRINGLEGQYTQFLLDSRPIFSSLSTIYGLEQLPAAMIERVEVIRGGGSALFGTNAIGGVVNIITKEPVRNSFTLTNQTGLNEKGKLDINTSLNASLVSDNHRSGMYIFGMIKHKDPYDRNDDGFSETPKLNSETLGFRGFHKLNASSRLTAEYHHIREFRRGGNAFDLPPHETDITEQLEHNINGGGLKYDFMSKDYKHKLNLYSSVQSINRNSYFGAKDGKGYGKTSDFTGIVGTQYTYTFDKLLFLPSELVVGSEYTWNNLQDKMVNYNRDIQQNTCTYGLFFQNEWKNEEWGILLGGRLDKHNKISKPVFNPRVNLRYKPLDLISFRLSYSSGYRAPQMYDEDLHISAVSGTVLIIEQDPNLRPEYSQSISGSVDLYHKFGVIEMNLLLEGFYTTLDDVFVLVNDTEKSDDEITYQQRQNASGATVAGMNAELKAGFKKYLVFSAGFTVQRSNYKEDFSWSKELAGQRRMFRSPDMYGFLTLDYRPINPLTVSTSLNYTGPMLVRNERKIDQKITPNFWDMGLRIAYNFKISQGVNFEVSSGVKNILDSYQKDLEIGVDRDSKYFYGPIMPRTYFLGVKFLM